MKIRKEMEVNTYPQMNRDLKDLLRLTEQPMAIYAAARIEELEGQLKEERRKRRELEKSVTKREQ